MYVYGIVFITLIVLLCIVQHIVSLAVGLLFPERTKNQARSFDSKSKYHYLQVITTRTK